MVAYQQPHTSAQPRPTPQEYLECERRTEKKSEPQYELLSGLRSLRNPTLLIEVLSETTENRDRKEKFDGYWTLESLQTYVLV